MSVKFRYLVIRRGEDWSRRFRRRDGNGDLIPMAGAYARLTCKRRPSDVESLFDIDSEDLGGVTIDAESNEIQTSLTAEQTAALEAQRECWVTLWIEYGTGERQTWPLMKAVIQDAAVTGRPASE